MRVGGMFVCVCVQEEPQDSSLLVEALEMFMSVTASVCLSSQDVSQMGPGQM